MGAILKVDPSECLQYHLGRKRALATGKSFEIDQAYQASQKISSTYSALEFE